MMNPKISRATEIAVPLVIAATLWVPRLAHAPAIEAALGGLLCVAVVVCCALRERLPVVAPVCTCLSTVIAWHLETTNDPLIAFSWSLMPLGVRHWKLLSSWVPLLWVGVFVSLVMVVDGGRALGVAPVMVALILAEAEGRRLHAMAREAELAFAANAARELHDSIGHSLSLIRAEAGLGLMSPGAELDGARAPVRETLERIDRHAQQAYQGLEVIVSDLAPGGAAEMTIADVIAADRAAGLAVTVRGQIPDDGVPVQIVQEMLRNVRRHGNGSGCELEFSRTGGEWIVRCTNRLDALGEPTVGRGLGNIEERVRALGGSAEWGVKGGALPAEFFTQVRIPVAPVATGREVLGGVLR